MRTTLQPTIPVCFSEELLAFSWQLDAEEQRAIGENLSEEELAVFDLLTQPDHSLTGEEEQRVKEIAHDLLVALKNEKLVLDWRKRQQARAGCAGHRGNA